MVSGNALSPWVFESKYKDISAFYSLSFLCIVLVSLVKPQDSLLYISLLVTIVLDTGHAYTTILRTYLNPRERGRLKIYWIAPFVIFGICFLWNYLGIPFFWTTVIYFTFYHHFRQYYGVTRWYESLSSQVDKKDHYFLTLFVFLPYIGFHFRDLRGFSFIYVKGETIFLGIEQIWKTLLILNLIVLLYYFISRLVKIVKKQYSSGKFISIFYPAMLHLYCFNVPANLTSVIFPLLIVHAQTYFALIGLSLERTGQAKSFKQGIFFVIVIAVFFSFSEYLISENYISYFPSIDVKGQLVLPLLYALVITPNILHYVLDAVIWKKDHPEFKKIVKKGSLAIH